MKPLIKITYKTVAKKDFTQISLPTDLVEDLKVLRMAFSNCAAKPVSFEEMIRGMMDSLKETGPDVFEEYNRIVSKRADVTSKTETDESDKD